MYYLRRLYLATQDKLNVKANTLVRAYTFFRMLQCHVLFFLRYGVPIHDLCSQPLSGSFFRESFRRSYLGVEFAHRVRCVFELMMIRDGILSVSACMGTANR